MLRIACPVHYSLLARKRLLVFVLLGALAGCSKPELVAPEPHSMAAGNVVSIEPLTGYSHLTLRALFRWQGIGKINTERGIWLYRIVYWTTAADNRMVKASGLLAYPKGDQPIRGIVSWQHGTASLRSAAPSELDVFNGLLPAALFAGHGYILLAPDYIGMGVSSEPHSYYHTASIAGAVVDMLHASKSVFENNRLEWPTPLFLSGFSQGGHASMAAQRLIENTPAGITVDATASVAGVVDLSGIGIRSALQGESKFSSLYLAWIAWTYARDYGMPLADILNRPYVALTDEIFDGAHSGDDIVAALPRDPQELLATELLTAIENNSEHWFLQRLHENSLLDWTPRAPLRLYYGELDVDVTPAQAQLMETISRERGADVTAISVGKSDHEGSILDSVIRLRDWFDELSNE